MKIFVASATGFFGGFNKKREEIILLINFQISEIEQGI